jgi:radical SAM-linked protein
LRGKKLRFKWHEAQMSFMEGVFARGDRRLGAVLERAVRLGCRFDGWRDHFRWDLWQQAFAGSGLDPSWYLRERDEDEVLPWSHIDCGFGEGFLLAERRRSRDGSYTPDCRDGKCSGCGVCDFERLAPRRAEAEVDARAATPFVPPVAEDEQEPCKVRLRVSKTGRARFVGHLDFMTAFHRAVRRAGLPVRFSGGFHPAPQISFPDALPTGLESETEIIDLKLRHVCSPERVQTALNAQLPEGFEVQEAFAVPWKTPAPSVSIQRTEYRVALPQKVPTDLDERIAAFLASSEVPVLRLKKGREQTVDVRPGVCELRRMEDVLWLTLAKGSPMPVLAWLLDLPAGQAPHLAVRKTAVRLD